MVTQMNEQESRKLASTISTLFNQKDITDDEIIRQIKEVPEVIHVLLPSTANLFMESIFHNRFQVTKVLVEIGSDIHIKCKPSLIKGNALNVARSPEQADYLLGLGIEIERNLSMREPFINPAIAAVQHNDKTMVLYWISKQKELFANDEPYLRELIYATINNVTIMNQYGMISCIIADEELFSVLKEIYSKEDNEQSIKLILSALRHIKDEEKRTAQDTECTQKRNRYNLVDPILIHFTRQKSSVIAYKSKNICTVIRFTCLALLVSFMQYHPVTCQSTFLFYHNCSVPSQLRAEIHASSFLSDSNSRGYGYVFAVFSNSFLYSSAFFASLSINI